jgi:hypothetical protein
MIRILLLTIFIGYSSLLSAQSSLDPAWSVGISAFFSTNQHKVGGYMDQYQITNHQNSPNLMRFGVHAQARFPNFSIRPELNYSTTSFIMLVRNLAVPQAEWKAFSAQENFRKVELYLPMGFYIKDNVMLELGLVGGRRIFQRPSDTTVRRFSGSSLPDEALLDNISGSFHSWNLDWRAGLTINGGPLNFSLAYQANLTPVGSQIRHGGTSYIMEQDYSQFMLGAGLQLFRW